jgi:hypothetical protein
MKSCVGFDCSFPLILTGDIDTQSTEFYAPSRALAFGLYYLTLHIQLVDNPNLKSSSSVYIQITPSGITANPVPLGTSVITSGTYQDILLDPGTYSLDPDADSFDATVSDRKTTILSIYIVNMFVHRNGNMNTIVVSMIATIFLMFKEF